MKLGVMTAAILTIASPGYARDVGTAGIAPLITGRLNVDVVCVIRHLDGGFPNLSEPLGCPVKTFATSTSLTLYADHVATAHWYNNALQEGARALPHKVMALKR
ncbi:hypothetical protein [Sulfitobacter guttiformis]|uniref:Uncharacterized protein n=1 Tax=Sulfitobacter guttiformis TaxID=74349 RepID=A0A420DMZ0_9RHOB|nr:hypothetical protein [Sulfitobacter guttiformis]KIN72902.1 hypothetical protein Z949_2084 [Sulfitobacter guttiformis KCTC 32187]RKE95591.1 hypothetical protein C8N30_0128 [Sulfitobacter guttiformis]